jgi:hypothetical protein
MEALKMGRPIVKGSTDQSVIIKIIDSADGTPETGVVYNTAGIDLWYRREGAAVVSITEATLAAVDSAHADGGFKHISHGYYRLDLPDAAVATGANSVLIGGTVTGMIVVGNEHPLWDVNPYDGVRMGMTALPNAVPDASGGLPVTGSQLTAIPWNAAWDAEIESECQDALVANNLDHLCKTATATSDMTTEVTDGTVVSRIISKTSDTSTYNVSTDSLEALRDRGDAAWITATGFATPTNITAGTITTVTNLTNAPTNGDLTATMKSSVTAAVPATGAIADAVADEVYEGTITLRQAIKLVLSVLTGKTSGGGTSYLVFRDIGDTKNRLAATVDANNNRTDITTRDGA